MTRLIKTAAELENMITGALISRNECPHQMKVSVVRLGTGWTALTPGIDGKVYANCVSQVSRIVEEFRTKFDLAALSVGS